MPCTSGGCLARCGTAIHRTVAAPREGDVLEYGGGTSVAWPRGCTMDPGDVVGRGARGGRRRTLRHDMARGRQPTQAHSRVWRPHPFRALPRIRSASSVPSLTEYPAPTYARKSATLRFLPSLPSAGPLRTLAARRSATTRRLARIGFSPHLRQASPSGGCCATITIVTRKGARFSGARGGSSCRSCGRVGLCNLCAGSTSPRGLRALLRLQLRGVAHGRILLARCHRGDRPGPPIVLEQGLGARCRVLIGESWRGS